MLAQTLSTFHERPYILVFDGSSFPEDKDFEEMLANVSEETRNIFLEFHFLAIEAILLFAENQEYIAWLEKICNVYGLSAPTQFRAEVTQFYFENMFGGYAFNPRHLYELSLPKPSTTKQKLVRNILI